MPSNDPIRSANAKAAALTRVAKEGGAAVSAPARRAFLDKFLNQVDPDRVLPEIERQKRAQAARKAYFTRLAAKSAQARRNKANAALARRQAEELRGLAAAIETGGDVA